MSNPLERIEAPASAARSSKAKSSSLSAPQAAHESALATSASSAADGKRQAMNDAQAFALGYAQTTSAVTPIVSGHIQAARAQMSAAISSVSVEAAVGDVNDSDFLSAFSSELASLLGASQRNQAATDEPE